MAYICLECFEVYNINLTTCPKAGCGEQVVEIDDLMILPIQILRSKGYPTEGCCSGHIYGNDMNAYICFDTYWSPKLVNKHTIKKLFANLPTGWTLDLKEFDRRCKIRYDLNKTADKNPITIYKEIAEANVALLDFIKQLPEI